MAKLPQLSLMLSNGEKSAPEHVCTSPTGDPVKIRDGFCGFARLTPDGTLLEAYYTSPSTLQLVVCDAANRQRRVVCLRDADTFRLLHFDAKQLVFALGTTIEHHVYGKLTVAIEADDHPVVACIAGDGGCLWWSEPGKRIAVRHGSETHGLRTPKNAVVAIVADDAVGFTARAFVINAEGAAVCAAYEYNAVDGGIESNAAAAVQLGAKGFGFVVADGGCAAAVVRGETGAISLATLWSQGGQVELYVDDAIPQFGGADITLLSAQRVRGSQAVEICMTVKSDPATVLFGAVGPGIPAKFVAIPVGKPVLYGTAMVERDWTAMTKSTLLPEADAKTHIAAADKRARKFLRDLAARDIPNVGSEYSRGEFKINAKELRKAAKRITELDAANKNLKERLRDSEDTMAEITAESYGGRLRALEESMATALPNVKGLVANVQRVSERATELRRFQLKTTTAKDGSLEHKLKATLRRLLATQDELAAAHADRDATLIELGKLRSSEPVKQLAVLQKELDAVQGELERHKSGGKMKELEEKIETLEAKLKELEADDTVTPADELEARVTLLNEELERHQAESAAREKRLAGFNKVQSLADTRKNEIDRLKKELGGTQRKLETATNELKAAKKKLEAGARTSLADAKELERQLAATTAELAEATKSLEASRSAAKAGQAALIDLQTVCREHEDVIRQHGQTWDFTVNSTRVEQIGKIRAKAIAEGKAQAAEEINRAVASAVDAAKTQAIAKGVAQAAGEIDAAVQRAVADAKAKAIDAELATADPAGAVADAKAKSIDAAIAEALNSKRFRKERSEAVAAAKRVACAEAAAEAARPPSPASTTTEGSTAPPLYDGATGWELLSQLTLIRQQLLKANHDVGLYKASSEQIRREYNALQMMMSPATGMMPDGSITIYALNSDGTQKLMDDGTPLCIALSQVRDLAGQAHRNAELERLRSRVLDYQIKEMKARELERTQGTPPTSPASKQLHA